MLVETTVSRTPGIKKGSGISYGGKEYLLHGQCFINSVQIELDYRHSRTYDKVVFLALG